MKRTVLLFTALVGQEKLKKALILNAINPNLQGVLIKGEKGTAKSTAVRALAELLPEIEVVKCPFNCSPHDPSLQCEICNEKWRRKEKLPKEKRKMRVVDFPLGATEDRVIGTVDIEKALKEGIKALQPGILADVNQGILYIDEVNLLDDHLVDILLDSAAMGINIIQREGISLSHPSKFILVGTMNPEEGEIRPQLLDRFGLSVEVKTLREVEERIEIIKTVEEFAKAPLQFSQRYEGKQRKLRESIIKAMELLNEVVVPERLLCKIAEICINFAVDGHRADFLIARTAKTIAAFNERKVVTEEDVKEAAEFVLPHRMKKKPFEQPQPLLWQEIERIIGKKEESKQKENNKYQDNRQQEQQESSSNQDKQDNSKGNLEKVFDIGEQRKLKFKLRKDKKQRIGSGRRAKTLSSCRGKYIKSKIPQEKASDIAVDATMRASIIRKGSLQIEEEDLREKVREKKISSTIVFVVDASGSMGAMQRMEVAKGAVMALLEEAYQKRDKVGFVAFRKERAEVLLPPTSSQELAANCLKELPTGGKTPLSDGLYKGLEILKSQMRKSKNIIPIMVLISDGRGNIPLGNDVRKEVISLGEEIKRQGINLVVVDCNSGFLNLGYNRELAEISGGQYYSLDKLDTQNLMNVVKPLVGFCNLKNETTGKHRYETTGKHRYETTGKHR
ncbi:MAG: putative cobaltochelatase [bacterium]